MLEREIKEIKKALEALETVELKSDVKKTILNILKEELNCRLKEQQRIEDGINFMEKGFGK